MLTSEINATWSFQFFLPYKNLNDGFQKTSQYKCASAYLRVLWAHVLPVLISTQKVDKSYAIEGLFGIMLYNLGPVSWDRTYTPFGVILNAKVDAVITPARINIRKKRRETCSTLIIVTMLYNLRPAS